MKFTITTSLAFAVALLLTACDDETGGIGTSLTDNDDHLEVSTTIFKASSRSVAAESILARSSTGYLGRIKDPVTGGYITSDFMTQFNCLESYRLTPIDSVASRYDDGKVYADSCELRLFYESYYGDSLALMKLTAYEMEKPMSEAENYYTDFDPEAAGLLRTDGIRTDQSFSLVNTAETEQKTDKSSYMNNIRIKLNDPYTDRNGVSYNNFGTYLLQTYYAHPEYFKNGITFIKHVLPGFYFKITGGVGGMAYVSAPQINIYYRLYMNNRDSIADQLTLFSGTEEVLQTTRISNDNERLNQLISDKSCTYVKGPAGILTEITLPVDEIMAGHENDTINTARLMMQRYNDNSYSLFNLSMPSKLLMVEKDSLDAFFIKGKIANYKQSFVASFNNQNNSYNYGNIGSLITHLYSMKKAGLAKDPNWVASHPDWNKVLLVPVTTTVDSYNKLTSVTNDITLTNCRLVGGENALTINVIYSKFK